MTISTSLLSDLLDTSIGGVWGKLPGEDAVDVDVLRVTELRPGGELDPSTAARRSISHRQLGSRSLRQGDLLLEKSGGGPTTPVGRVGLIRELNGPSVCSNFMQLMRPRSDRVEPRFLHLYLTYLHSTGATVPLQTASTNIRNIKTSDYFKIKVPLPALDEQRRIIDILEAHLSRIQAGESLLDLSRSRAVELRQLVAESAYRVFDRALWVSLAQLSHFVTDGDHNPPRRVDQGVPHITAKGIRDGSISLAGCSFVSEEGFAQTASRYLPTEGDVIVTCVGTIGRVAVVPAGLRFSADRNLAAIRLDTARMLPDFLALLLNSVTLQRRMRSVSGSTAQPHLYLRDIRSTEVPAPDLTVQRQVVAAASVKLDSANRLESDVARARSQSTTLRRALLQAAFDGRLTARTSEEELEGLALEI